MITSPVPGAWNRCTFTAVNTTAGTHYWTAILQPTGIPGTLKFRNDTSRGQTYGSSSAALSSLPAGWGNGPNWGAQTGSIYADKASTTTDPTPSPLPDPTPTPTPTPTAPTASFSSSPSSPSTGQAVTFDASASTCAATPCTYRWEDDGPDGQGGTQWPLGSGAKLQFTFQEAGTKRVRLTVTDANGQTGTVEHDLTVSTASSPSSPTTDPSPSPTPDPSPSPSTPAPSGCDLHATTGNLGSVFSGAAGGQTICLASGDYGNWTGGSKSSMVTLTPESGASVSMGVNFGSNVSNVRLYGINKLGGWKIDSAKNVQIAKSTFTAPTSVIGSTPGLVFDGDTFDNLPAGTWEGRLSFGSSANGAVVRNSHFGNGGCSDGIQFTGGAHDITVDGNEFSGIKQGSCTQHADPIQFYGGSSVKITNNYFHGNSTGIMSGDGNGSPMTVTGNVFVTDGEYPDQIVIGGGSGDVVRHNTLANGARIRVGKVNVGLSTNETLTDNVVTGGFYWSEGQTTSGSSVDYNLSAAGSPGTHSIKGSPTYTSGSSPSTYSGYRLGSTSLGVADASDGNNMGITG
jgi:hypothetical protein